MASREVPPLRISKCSGGNTSPSKLPRVTARPLSELSPMAIRRNSPSFPQNKAKSLTDGATPVSSSPFSQSSPHLFWQQRDPASPASELPEAISAAAASSPHKRSSIENLKKASRVKNSSMFAIEQSRNYDPARPQILDGRPLSMQFNQPRSPARELSSSPKKENISPAPASRLDAQKVTPPEDFASSTNSLPPLSPSRLNSSPAKSSLSKRTGAAFRRSGFDPETGIWEDDDDQEKNLPPGRALHRHHKSVTFDQAPPQINEYEMTTPAPSESCASGSRDGSCEGTDDEDDEDEDMSFERGSSMDHDDSFDASLEDTDKTPVVLPEDWRFMSPDTANTDLSRDEEDVFDDDVGSPAPSARPTALAYRPHQTSASSVDSNGQSRPLPPLPPTIGGQNKSRSDSLSGAFERMSMNGQRSLPAPPQAATFSKVDILNIRVSNSLSAEDRVRLAALQEEERERRRRRMNGSKEASPFRSPVHDVENDGGPGPEVSNDPIPHGENASHLNTRLSMGQAVFSGLRRSDSDRSDTENTLSHARAASYDPDVPIPSLEDPTVSANRKVVVKEEEIEEDIYSIPELYSRRNASSDEDTVSATEPDDLASEYSQNSYAALPPPPLLDDEQSTPKAQTPARESPPKPLFSERVSLPEFADFGDTSSFNMGLGSYLSQEEEKSVPVTITSAKPASEPSGLPDLAALRQNIQRASTPDTSFQQQSPRRFGRDSVDPGTPGSVVRHSIAEKPMAGGASPELTPKLPPAEDETSRSVSPVSDTGSVIYREQNDRPPVSPETIEFGDKAEVTPNDQQTTETSTAGESEAAARLPPAKRVSSLVPLDLPQSDFEDGLSLGLEKEFDRVVETQKVEFELSLRNLYYPFNGRFPSGELPGSMHRRPSSTLKNCPVLSGRRETQSLTGGDPLSHCDAFANRDFRRQRGYLMRQNTKVVVASERMSQDEPRSPGLRPDAADGFLAPASPEANHVQESPRKTSQPTWTAEPWNGKSRRKSIRVGGEKSMGHRKPVGGPVPPLPGHASNAQESLDAVTEDDIEAEEDWEEGAERGRLFVKVVGVKDLQMPFPQHEQTYFSLTLDNGMHCVTTAWLNFARSAPIGQEFELVVLNDLEFQLTLQMKLDPPKVERPQSPSKPPSSPKKQGAFGRLFGSPKKKKESEVRAFEEAQAAKRPVSPPSAYELVQGLVAQDGSFARAYVALGEHEKNAYGRPYNVDITCFNEWAMEEVSVGSSRSKKPGTQMQRRPPYEIGKLELQLLYVPKPKGAKDEDMPKSMNSAVRALREAEERMQQQANIKGFEGHLSQQGGDCPYWRRRFFKLVGTKLTAYHETTRQPRATINLAKASRLIDDKSSLMQKETSTKGGGRRKSGFAEEEEGYMFVEEGFRIRFANGEVIDFYAESTSAKDEWMQALSQVVGKGVQASTQSVKGWTEMVLKREKKAKAEKEAALQSRSTHARTESYQPGFASQANSPVKKNTAERHRKTKSMHA